MIAGVGVDVVEIARFAAVVARQGGRFLRRVFTPGERRTCEGKPRPMAHFAARFAAKEAVLKALGTGLTRDMRWHDVEVVRERAGRPAVRLSGRVLEVAGDGRVHLSVSHSESTATAVAIVERSGISRGPRRTPRRP
ncbi:MAG: holo-ACP synthase [Planctomycetes bacterium]|nr:holo-ACP synthase [Planctomycetota bacterium]